MEVGKAGSPNNARDQFSNPKDVAKDANNYLWVADWCRGVTINPVNGDIFVTDLTNHRVQIYTSQWVYEARIGVTGEAGSDNSHLSYPYGVAIKKDGIVYITANNDVTGTEVWATSDGGRWSQANFDGWGDSNNGFSLRGNAGANFKNNLLISKTNSANGREIWQMLHQVYLPFTKK